MPEFLNLVAQTLVLGAVSIAAYEVVVIIPRIVCGLLPRNYLAIAISLLMKCVATIAAYTFFILAMKTDFLREIVILKVKLEWWKQAGIAFGALATAGLARWIGMNVELLTLPALYECPREDLPTVILRWKKHKNIESWLFAEFIIKQETKLFDICTKDLVPEQNWIQKLWQYVRKSFGY